MSTHHRPSMRTLVATLLALALLFMLVAPYVDAAETITLSKNVTLISQTLDGTVLNATAAATATATVHVLLQRCTVQGAGLTVGAVVELWKFESTALTLHILDTTVKDATLAFRNFLPGGPDVRIVNVTATMEGTTPLFDLQNFYLGWVPLDCCSYSIKIQHVRATWGTGAGGSVVQMGGRYSVTAFPDDMFSLSEAVVTGAAHVLEITSECTGDYCLDTSGLIAFDLIELHDARGAFVYSNIPYTPFANYMGGMTRFSNITMTGGQPFFEARNGSGPAMLNNRYSTMVFSAISNDGPLFSLVPGADITAASPDARYSFRHINVGSVMSAATSYTENVPVYVVTSDEASTFYMGNITVAGQLMNTIDELESNQLFATQLVGAYGEVIEVRQGGSWPQPSIGTAAAVNCGGVAEDLTGTGGTAGFVELVRGVQRAECDCQTNYNTPYCTTAIDPLVYYDAYSPSPATCDVANCESCLFGQASQCGACAFGYGLTAALRCEIIPCNVARCNGCTTDNVCGSCGDGYSLSPDKTGCYTCNIANCNGCTADDVCGSCGDGYTLSADKTACYACNIANCNGCTADDVCGSCGDGYTLSADKTACYACNIANCNGCTADDVCNACTDSYVLTATGTCTKCTVSHCSQCTSPGDGTQCAACSDGSTLSADESTCYTCGIPNCNGCTADGVCGSCGDGYKLKGTSECKKNGVGWWVWLIVGIAAAAVVAGIIVLVVCCVRRRPSKAGESSPSMRASSNTAMRRDQSDATETQRYGTVTSAGAAPPNPPAPSGAYQWSFADCNAARSTQGSWAAVANPFDSDYP